MSFPRLLSVFALAWLAWSCASAEESNRQPTATLAPLPAELAEKLCSLTRRSSEQDLYTRFGSPTEKREANGMLVLTWETPTWRADAMMSDGELQIAGVYVRQERDPESSQAQPPSEWQTDETRLEEMEAELGPGVRVGVQWHKGVEVAASIRNQPDFDASITRDRCSERYAWVDLDLGGFTSLRFENGVLKGAL